MKASTKPGRAASVALLCAAVWALGLLVAGWLVPVYQSTSISSSGEQTRSTETLVGVNGPGVLIVLAIPLLATLLVAGALLVRPRRGALPLAWALTALLAGVNLLAMLTIGIFILPVTAALVVACATCTATAVAVAP